MGRASGVDAASTVPASLVDRTDEGAVTLPVGRDLVSLTFIRSLYLDPKDGGDTITGQLG